MLGDGNILSGAVLNRSGNVVFHALAHARQIRNTLDTELGQMFSIADTGQHQEVWRVNSSSAQDNFFVDA
ncbi:hypothetical protein D9M71_684160 [compost metagenome]